MSQTDALKLTETKGMILIPVKVVPGASRDKIVGLLDGALKISVSAPPERGKANDAVIELLAKTLNVRRSQVQVAAGHTTPRKTVAVAGLDVDRVRARLTA